MILNSHPEGRRNKAVLDKGAGTQFGQRSRLSGHFCVFFFYFFNVYLFLREREREKEREREQGRSREIGRYRIRSRLQTPSYQHRPDAGLELTNREIVT